MFRVVGLNWRWLSGFSYRFTLSYFHKSWTKFLTLSHCIVHGHTFMFGALHKNSPSSLSTTSCAAPHSKPPSVFLAAPQKSSLSSSQWLQISRNLSWSRADQPRSTGECHTCIFRVCSQTCEALPPSTNGWLSSSQCSVWRCHHQNDAVHSMDFACRSMPPWITITDTLKFYILQVYVLHLTPKKRPAFWHHQARALTTRWPDPGYVGGYPSHKQTIDLFINGFGHSLANACRHRSKQTTENGFSFSANLPILQTWRRIVALGQLQNFVSSSVSSSPTIQSNFPSQKSSLLCTMELVGEGAQWLCEEQSALWTRSEFCWRKTVDAVLPMWTKSTSCSPYWPTQTGP